FRLRILLPTKSILFPYTTLFRSIVFLSIVSFSGRNKSSMDGIRKNIGLSNNVVSTEVNNTKNPPIAGPTIMAPELEKERMALKRFLFSLGISIVVYVIDEGVKKEFDALSMISIL